MTTPCVKCTAFIFQAGTRAYGPAKLLPGTRDCNIAPCSVDTPRIA